MADAAPEDIRTRIDNTIAILEAQISQERGSAQHGFHIAVDTLRAARKAIDERDAELELVTTPELKAAEEAQRLQKELVAAEARAVGFEQQLAMLRQEHEVEEHLHDEDRKRLEKLKKRADDFDQVLMTDKDAFSRFMDKALEKDAPKKRPKP